MSEYHFIYKTICKITNNYYIGMHSTNNLNDGYLGSGKKLWASIYKYGKNNHELKILEFCTDRNALAKREKEIVNENLISDKNCMNMTIGGDDSSPSLLNDTWDNTKFGAQENKWKNINNKWNKLKF